MPLAICVYCSSSEAIAPHFFEEARALGNTFASRGHTLVYGGGSVGLMGELARTVLDGGGRVVGIIPQFLVERELALHHASELVITATMRERKAAMAERAEAFIALPGGFGTFEEILEILTLKQLGLHAKPCILANIQGYFDPLIRQFENAFDQKFTNAAYRSLYQVANHAVKALDMLEKACEKRGCSANHANPADPQTPDLD